MYNYYLTFKFNEAFLTEFKCPTLVQTLSHMGWCFNRRVLSCHHIILGRKGNIGVVPSMITPSTTLLRTYYCLFSESCV